MKKRSVRTIKKRCANRAGVVLLAAMLLLSVSGCGGSERALVHIGIPSIEEKDYTTTFVVRGDVTYELEEELHLVNYVESKYGLSSKLMDSMMLKDVAFDKLYVSVGDKVKKGDVLLTMSSKSLEDEIDSYTEQKEKAQLEKIHYNNRTAIDNEEDNSIAIARCDQDINVATGYLAELESKKENLTIRADEDGEVIYISDQAISGTMSNTDGLLTIASGDDTYFLETEEKTTLSVGQIVTSTNKLLRYDMVVTNVEKSSAGTKAYFKILGIEGKVENESEVAARLVGMASPGDATETDAMKDAQVSDREKIIVHGLTVPIAEETRKDVLYVASSAVTERDGRYFVFMIDEHGARVAREIKVESILGEYAIITDGLVEGDEVLAEAK
ncbi:MAG: hypothetical protein II492_05575 [Eubacterium sp.]|nr:hypothetical protein [Eubacterium sp.]